MRVVVIGGTGHIGTHLVPALVDLGHEVVVVSRGQRRPYHALGSWSGVERVEADRAAEDAAGTFGARIAELSPTSSSTSSASPARAPRSSPTRSRGGSGTCCTAAASGPMAPRWWCR